MGDVSSWVGVGLQTVGILSIIGAFVFRLHLDLKLLVQSQIQMQKVVTSHEEQLKQVGQVLIDLARQDVRLTNLESRMHELSTRLYAHIRKEDVE